VALEFEVAIGQVLDAEFSVLPLVSIDPLSFNAEVRRFILNKILILIFELSLCLKSKQSLFQVTGKAFLANLVIP
jgi:hypothetical protein